MVNLGVYVPVTGQTWTHLGPAGTIHPCHRLEPEPAEVFLCSASNFFRGVGLNASVAVQDCILLDRGFPIRRPLASPAGVENPASCRLEIGETADLEVSAALNFVRHPFLRHPEFTDSPETMDLGGSTAAAQSRPQIAGV